MVALNLRSICGTQALWLLKIFSPHDDGISKDDKLNHSGYFKHVLKSFPLTSQWPEQVTKSNQKSMVGKVYSGHDEAVNKGAHLGNNSKGVNISS